MDSGMQARGPKNPAPTSMKRETDVFIVGAGIMGLSVAYHLARHGVTDVVVADRGYLAGGASGRNGGGIRMQWSTEMNVRLMQESVELCKRFARDLGVNVWLRQGGYLFLARTEKVRAQLEKSTAVQNRYGVKTRLITAEEARQIVPDLDVSEVLCATFNPHDGIIFPWPFLWGYAEQASRRGVQIHPFTAVTAIERDDKGFRVTTSKGEIRARRLVNAAGAWSPSVARMVGVTLPNHPHRHEILSTEPLKPFLGPMVSVLESGLYFSQSMRGEIVTGITVPDDDEAHAGSDDRSDEKTGRGDERASVRRLRPRLRANSGGPIADDAGVRLGSRLRFLTTLSKELLRVMPRLGQIRVLRQWAGPYDISPDGKPFVGEQPGVPDFHNLCGFMGHGFMMAPVVGKYYGEWLSGGAAPPFLHEWRLARIAEGDVEQEDMIIG